MKKEISSLVKNSKIQNIEQSIKNHCFLILAQGKKEIYEISNFIAPEHLHIHSKFSKDLLKNIIHAGSVFVGEKAPVALGTILLALIMFYQLIKLQNLPLDWC